MGQGKNNSRGFTLIAALLILVLLSGVAAGLLYMVTNESRMGGNDLEANLAYYGAESGMEKLTADLSALYTQYMIPTNSQIQNLVNYPPTSAMVGSISYTPPPTITYPVDGSGNPVSSWNTVSSGSNQGLYAEIIPMTMQVIATRPSGASANVTRKVEIALIPVFQFGVFCGYDCSYFPGPNFSFGGRVHTNQSLFLAAGGDLVFDDKISAYTQVVMDELENGHLTTTGYGGTVYVPKASGGCALNTFPPTAPNCVALPGAGTVPGDASWSGGYPGKAGGANANFPSISSGTLNGFVTNSLTGAKNMQLPFVQNSCTSNPPPCTDPIAIIRKPQPGESATSTLGTSRLYNKAEIRILLADTVADLHPERGLTALDADDVQFTPGGFQPLSVNANTSESGRRTRLRQHVLRDGDGGHQQLGCAHRLPHMGDVASVGRTDHRGHSRRRTGRVAARGVHGHSRSLARHYPRLAQLQFHSPVQPSAHWTCGNGGQRSLQSERDHHPAADGSGRVCSSRCDHHGE